LAYKENMTGTESNADVAIRVPLKKLVPNAQFQKRIILDATNVDVLVDRSAQGWPSIVALLDGPVHLTSNAVKLRDELVTNALEQKGIVVMRFPYKPPLSKKQMDEICAKIAARAAVY
jgi:very-short-patch-repair endonuclease